MRDASAAQIANNVEIQNIKQIMGLQHGKVDPQPFASPAGDLCCCSQRLPQDPFPSLKPKNALLTNSFFFDGLQMLLTLSLRRSEETRTILLLR